MSRHNSARSSPALQLPLFAEDLPDSYLPGVAQPSTTPQNSPPAPASSQQAGHKGKRSAAGDDDSAVPPTVDYQLFRSRRKTLSIYVEQGRLVVRAPLHASQSEIESFIQSKQDWIARQLLEDARRQHQRPVLRNGAAVTVLGETWGLEIICPTNASPRRRGAIENNGSLRLLPGAARPADASAQTERLFRDWLKSKAAPYLEHGSRQLAARLGMGNRLRDIKYRFTRSKWGHCTSEGDIQYNPAIALAPLPVVDYIIAHEVCHLRHKNHSDRFWALVESVCPDWREAERWLRDHGHRADFTATQAL